MEYLIYVNGIVLRHQRPAPLSVTNVLTELKDSIKHKEKREEHNIRTEPSDSSLVPQEH